MSVSFSLQVRPTFGVMKSWGLNVHNNNKKKKNAVTHRALTNAKTNQNKAREKQKKTKQKALQSFDFLIYTLVRLRFECPFFTRIFPNTLSLIFTFSHYRHRHSLPFPYYPSVVILDCTEHVSQVTPKRSNKIPLLTSSPTIPSNWPGPTIFNKVQYPHLETTNSFEGIIIPHPPICCHSFKQCEGGCGITFEGIVIYNSLLYWICPC